MSFVYSTKVLNIDSTKAESVVVITAGKQFGEQSKALDLKAEGYFGQLQKQKKLKNGKPQQLSLLEQGKIQHLCLISVGGETVAPVKLNQSLSQAAAALVKSPSKEIQVFADQAAIDLFGGDSHFAAALSKSLDYAAYNYDSTLSKSAPAPDLKRVVLASHNTKQTRELRSGLQQGQALASGLNLCRELGNLPGNYCTPAILGDKAKELAQSSSKLSVKVLGLKAIERLKMGSFLSVAKASSEEPRFIVFEYKGKSTGKPSVLVGKGITFDTGGISLKPGAGMDEMKFDMCGAASVFGCIKALAAMDAKVNVVGIVAAAENMPAGNASKPGDVVTSMSGKTIEVLNTDAEGRLILCDALTYAERFKPKAVIDIATLTGACVIALGSHASGLYANDQKLAEQLLEAGEQTGDRAWQMPLWDEYGKQLKSNFADMANIGGREAGSVTAACFLAKFTEAYAWAHLDVAGTAWNSGGNKGASGRPVELLINYLLANA
ncbi:leucyl aminopeptidase [Agaribacterium haliotis]|uniref:leucyl aminopeptidase n=1 Tax=Agaribacterium haliotis TaxID=2013869 RepID=UPI000BB57601|nr:leucyl aminopeptidase [Agaribacterium haliotis]